MFIGDILHIVILDFSADKSTLSVNIWCHGLLQDKLWSAWTQSNVRVSDE